ncbi:unnamed protein product [Strongylus vulgaris]|uniref:RING-type domain-containing protein n=1 Tax=Strongylus vulgaris TaxID=40348 RepID=A0A3P7IH99_STRVU|nr:unnamed protein product [Strongylus vulgaris]
MQSNEEALICGKCGGTAVVPMRTKGCAHIACYWCVASRGPVETPRCALCGKEGQAIPLRGNALL